MTEEGLLWAPSAPGFPTHGSDHTVVLFSVLVSATRHGKQALGLVFKHFGSMRAGTSFHSFLYPCGCAQCLARGRPSSSICGREAAKKQLGEGSFASYLLVWGTDDTGPRQCGTHTLGT